AEDELRSLPASKEIQAALEALRQKKAVADRQRAADSACLEIDRLINDGQYGAAGKRLERARVECGLDSRFDEIAARLEFLKFREDRLSLAQTQLQNRSFDLAKNAVTEVLDRNAQDPNALNLLSVIGRERAEQERQQKFAADRLAANRLLQDRQFEAAVRAFD